LYGADLVIAGFFVRGFHSEKNKGKKILERFFRGALSALSANRSIDIGYK
jgi:hypothetical protein